MINPLATQDPPHRPAPAVASLSHQWFWDPANVFAAVAPSVQLRAFQILVPQRDYYHFVGHLAIDRVHLMSFGSANVVCATEACPRVHLVAASAGTHRVSTPHGVVETTGGHAYLLPMGEREASGSMRNAVFALEPEAIAGAAAAIAGLGPATDGAENRWSVFQPRAWPAGSKEAQLIHALVSHVNACAAVDPTLPARLALDDLIHRQVAALLHPSLLEESPDGEADSALGRSSALDDLIDHIRANLHQPLRLSDLEARSHYSRRALQYAFREKLQCSPMQWIRQQRLVMAMEKLQEGNGTLPSVQAVALGCGYRSLSHFSADFKRKFGLLPSEVRRRSL